MRLVKRYNGEPLLRSPAWNTLIDFINLLGLRGKKVSRGIVCFLTHPPEYSRDSKPQQVYRYHASREVELPVENFRNTMNTQLLSSAHRRA